MLSSCAVNNYTVYMMMISICVCDVYGCMYMMNKRVQNISYFLHKCQMVWKVKESRYCLLMFIPKKKEVFPMAWKQLLHSSYTVLSPAARMTNIPSLESCWLPATGASRKRPPRDVTSWTQNNNYIEQLDRDPSCNFSFHNFKNSLQHFLSTSINNE